MLGIDKVVYWVKDHVILTIVLLTLANAYFETPLGVVIKDLSDKYASAQASYHGVHGETDYEPIEEWMKR